MTVEEKRLELSMLPVHERKTPLLQYIWYSRLCVDIGLMVVWGDLKIRRKEMGQRKYPHS